MEHRRDADARTEMLGVGCDGQQGLGGGLEEDAIDLRLVLVGDVGDLSRQGKDDMEVGHRQELGLTRGEPVPGGCALAFGAVTVATGVIGDEAVAAVLASRDMAAQSRRAAGLDRRHDLELAEAQVARPGFAPSGPVGAEDIRDLQPSSGHASPDQAGGRGALLSNSSGLLTARKVELSTWL